MVSLMRATHLLKLPPKLKCFIEIFPSLFSNYNVEKSFYLLNYIYNIILLFLLQWPDIYIGIYNYKKVNKVSVVYNSMTITLEFEEYLDICKLFGGYSIKVRYPFR